MDRGRTKWVKFNGPGGCEKIAYYISGCPFYNTQMAPERRV